MITEKSFKEVTKELEELDHSKTIKHLKRSEWSTEMTKNKTLLWQIPKTTAEFIHEIVLEKKPKTVMEWGTSGGYSTLWIAKALQKTQGRIHTIEFFKERLTIAKQMLKKAGAENVEFHQGKIKDIISNWSNKPIDLLFIDAAKNYYYEHFKIIEQHLTLGAVILADNMLDEPQKVENFKEYLEKNPSYSTTLFPIDNGILFAIKIR
jgi:predicted O-methyltransferase YrrM